MKGRWLSYPVLNLSTTLYIKSTTFHINLLRLPKIQPRFTFVPASRHTVWRPFLSRQQPQTLKKGHRSGLCVVALASTVRLTIARPTTASILLLLLVLVGCTAKTSGMYTKDDISRDAASSSPRQRPTLRRFHPLQSRRCSPNHQTRRNNPGWGPRCGLLRAAVSRLEKVASPSRSVSCLLMSPRYQCVVPIVFPTNMHGYTYTSSGPLVVTLLYRLEPLSTGKGSQCLPWTSFLFQLTCTGTGTASGPLVVTLFGRFGPLETRKGLP